MRHILLFFGILLFTISIQAQPVVNENPYPLIECEDDGDGFAPFDLQQADADITLGDSSLYVTYHISVMDAQNNINALPSPYMNQVPYSDTVYAHVDDQSGVGYAVVPLDLWVQNPPLTQPMDLSQIDDDGDGFAVFDLTENDTIVLEGLNPSVFTVSYYESEINAEMDQYVIADPTVYQNLQNPQTIYVRVENMSGSCISFASFMISVESLSVDSFSLEDLALFPNPTSGNITIQSTQLTSEVSFLIYDIQGKMLFSQKIAPQNGSFVLDISSLEKGVYFVKISSEEKTAIRKLIKK